MKKNNIVSFSEKDLLMILKGLEMLPIEMESHRQCEIICNEMTDSPFAHLFVGSKNKEMESERVFRDKMKTLVSEISKLKIKLAILLSCHQVLKMVPTQETDLYLN